MSELRRVYTLFFFRLDVRGRGEVTMSESFVCLCQVESEDPQISGGVKPRHFFIYFYLQSIMRRHNFCLSSQPRCLRSQIQLII